MQVETFDSLAQAAGAMRERTHFLGGGTLVMRAVNYADPEVERLVRVRDAGLREIRASGDRISIGAGATMADILASSDLAFLAPAARAVGGAAIRNMGTIGGNLYAPHPYGDFAAALLALDGVAQLADGADQPLEQLLSNRAVQRPLVHAVCVARPMGDDFRFRKVSRIKPKGAAVMTMAAWLRRSAGRLSDVRVVYSAMGPNPQRVPAVERALEGASLDPAGIAPALAVAAEGIDPPDDALASAWYRRETAPVHLRRLLLGEDRR